MTSPDSPTEPLRRATRRLERLPWADEPDMLPGAGDGLVCERCGRPTGNEHQGHYFSTCSVTMTEAGFHFCCPGNCELHVP